MLYIYVHGRLCVDFVHFARARARERERERARESCIRNYGSRTMDHNYGSRGAWGAHMSRGVHQSRGVHLQMNHRVVRESNGALLLLNP